jgi:methylmalonyl-CoA mutase N-terminal domain/subunit
MTINSPAPVLLAMYVAAAERSGVDRSRLGGTLQNDILKEYQAQKEYVFPPRPSMRLVSDVMRFCEAEMPRWHPVSISGYHIREAGSTAAQELAFTVGNGFAYVEAALAAGLASARLHRLSFFSTLHRLLRGDREVPPLAPHLGPVDARRAERSSERSLQLDSTPRLPASRSPRSNPG